MSLTLSIQNSLLHEHAHTTTNACFVPKTDKNHWNAGPKIRLVQRARRPMVTTHTNFEGAHGPVVATILAHTIVVRDCAPSMAVFYFLCPQNLRTNAVCKVYPIVHIIPKRRESGGWNACTRVYEIMGRRYDDMRATRLQRQWPASYVTLCVILPLVMILGGKQIFHSSLTLSLPCADDNSFHFIKTLA